MKYKPNAAADGLYKILGLRMWVSYVAGVITLISAFAVLATAENNDDKGAAVATFVFGAAALGLAEFYRYVRRHMAEQTGE